MELALPLASRAFVAFAAALARWIVAQLPPTDAELEFLAIGKLPGHDDETKQ